MKWRLKLLISASVLLTACQEQTILRSSYSSDLTVLPVEYYSRSAVSGVEVSLLDATNQPITKSFSDDGQVIFEDLEKNELYKIQIGQGEMAQMKEILFDPTNATMVIETKAVQHAQALAVPVVKQLPQLPHGCEITSLTAVLQYYGADVDKMTMVSHLPRQDFTIVNGQKNGPDPHQAYAGNPASPQGTYVYAAPITKAAESYLATTNLPFQAQNISGSTTEAIEQYVAQGIPVVSWVTLDLSSPLTKEGWFISSSQMMHTMFTNLHAVVIVDVTEDIVEVMDPLKGIVQHPKQAFFASYQALGQQAMMVY